MKQFRALPLLASAFLLFGCDSEPTAPADGRNALEEREATISASGMAHSQTVTGHATWNFPDAGRFQPTRESFSFSAVRHTDGTVTGRWQVRDDYRNGGFFGWNFIITEGRFTCFTILPDGKTAWLGGVQEHELHGKKGGVQNSQPQSSYAILSVVDNGEPGAGLDLSTDLTYQFPNPDAATEHCATGNGGTTWPLAPIPIGNVQVRP